MASGHAQHTHTYTYKHRTVIQREFYRSEIFMQNLLSELAEISKIQHVSYFSTREKW